MGFLYILPWSCIPCTQPPAFASTRLSTASFRDVVLDRGATIDEFMDIVEEEVEQVAMFEDMVDETTEEGFPVDETVTSTESYGSFQIP